MHVFLYSNEKKLISNSIQVVYPNLSCKNHFQMQFINSKWVCSRKFYQISMLGCPHIQPEKQIAKCIKNWIEWSLCVFLQYIFPACSFLVWLFVLLFVFTSKHCETWDKSLLCFNLTLQIKCTAMHQSRFFMNFLNQFSAAYGIELITQYYYIKIILLKFKFVATDKSLVFNHCFTISNRH